MPHERARVPGIAAVDDADPRPGPDDRRARRWSRSWPSSRPSWGGGHPPGPAPVLPVDRVGGARRDDRDRDPVLPGPARADGPARRARSGTSRGSAAPTSSATSGTRWGTSSTTPTGSTRPRSGSSSSARSRSRTCEEYRLEPFSRRFVRHLPGWYAQKHPDEDWSETFAVWMTPGLDWRDDYADWPEALAKLDYCDRTMAALADLDPVVTADDLDEDVGELAYSVDQFYGDQLGRPRGVPRRARRRPPLDLRGPGPSRVRPARRPPRPGLGADPPPRARPGGERLPLDRPLPRADPVAAPPPRRPRRRTAPRSIPRSRRPPRSWR